MAGDNHLVFKLTEMPPDEMNRKNPYRSCNTECIVLHDSSTSVRSLQMFMKQIYDLRDKASFSLVSTTLVQF